MRLVRAQMNIGVSNTEQSWWILRQQLRVNMTPSAQHEAQKIMLSMEMRPSEPREGSEWCVCGNEPPVVKYPTNCQTVEEVEAV